MKILSILRPTFFKVILLSLISSGSVHALTDLYYPIEEDYFEIIVKDIDEDNIDLYKKRLQEVEHFVTKKIFPTIPLNLKRAVASTPLKIIFTNNHTAHHGLFVPTENELKIYITPDNFYKKGLYSLITHEFFHALHYKVNPDESSWIREGLASLYEYIILNDKNAKNINASLSTASISFLSEYSLENYVPALYGEHFLYFKYIYDKCGGRDLFWQMTVGKKGHKNISALDRILKDKNKMNTSYCNGFNNSYESFIVSKVLNKINYSAKDFNSNYVKKFKLISTTQKVPTFNNTKALFQLKNLTLPTMTPLYIKGEDYNKLNFSSDTKQYWIKQTYPYTAQTEMPSSDDLKKWNVLLYRLKNE